MLTWGTLTPGGGGGTRSENCWGCAAGHWKLEPKRSREKWYFGAKKIEFCEDLYPKDHFCVGGWEKTPQKDQVWYPEGQKRGSKPRHICITHHIGSTPPPRDLNPQQCRALLSSVLPNHPSTHPRWVKSCFGRVQNSGITYQLCVLLTCCLNLLKKNQYHGCSG